MCYNEESKTVSDGCGHKNRDTVDRLNVTKAVLRLAFRDAAAQWFSRIVFAEKRTDSYTYNYVAPDCGAERDMP